MYENIITCFVGPRTADQTDVQHVPVLKPVKVFQVQSMYPTPQTTLPISLSLFFNAALVVKEPISKTERKPVVVPLATSYASYLCLANFIEVCSK